MTDIYKFLLAKYGYAYNSDIRNISIDSDLKLLKQFTELSGSLTFNQDEGQTLKTLTLAHNLGYRPVYIPFFNWYDIEDGNAQKFYIPPLYASGVNGDFGIDSYVDANNVKFEAQVPHFFKRFSAFPDMYNNNWNYHLKVGDDSSDGGSQDTGLRFYGINIDRYQTIQSAVINVYISSKGSSTSDVKIKTWGIDEDNCGSIFENLGREKTTAVTSQNVSAGTIGEYFGINVKDQVQEIVNRGGWSNGNNMGFYIFNDGSPSNAYREDTDFNTNLIITLPGNVTLYFKATVFLDKIL